MNAVASKWQVFQRESARAWHWLRTDRLGFLTALLLLLAFIVQFGALVGIYWSRSHFGHSFDPTVYSTFEDKKSDASISQTFGLKEAEEARQAAATLVRDTIGQTMDRASQEMDQTRAKRNEISLIKHEAEKKADEFLQQAHVSLEHGLQETAMEDIQSALRLAPDYVPAIRKLAQYYEARKDFAQAKFQWERAAVVAQPHTSEMEEIQRNLDRLSTKAGESSVASAPPRVESPPPVEHAGPNQLSVLSVSRNDQPLQDLYDLCFNLRLSLGSRGEESSMDYNDTRVEVIFYDQSRTAGGTLIPIKVLSTVLKPKQAWATGTEQVLSVKYSVPKGYFRKKGQSFGSAYAFCGYVVNASYRGKVQDSYAYPSDVLSRYEAKTGGAP